ncbi:MAG: type II toxin-antitoxin system antitoxin SocA domain-containing protein [Bacteroidota bacterium]
MNQLKMQKLLYYVEAFHQAYFNRPLIEDEFEAWVHGPVSRKVWNELRDVSLIYGTFYFEEGEDVNGIIKEVESILAAEQVDLVGDVLEEYGKLSSYKLECLTHEEAPWKEARAGVAPGDPSNNVISKARMREFYREMLYGN